LGKFGKVAGAAVVGATAAVGALGVSSVKKFTEFETGMAEVFTLLPGVSEDAMSAMESQVLNLSNQMGILPQDAIPALYDALSAGVPTDNVFQFMEDASKLAIGGSIEAGEAVDILTTSVNAWAESGLTAAEAGDFLFTTVKLGKTTMGELNASMSKVAPTASALGVGLDEVGASLAVLTAGGMPTAQAATAMNSALAELGKTGTMASNAFAELNDGQTFNELIESGGSFEDAMVLISDSGESVIDMFSSIDAAKGVLALTAGDAEGLSANMAAMGDSSGAAGEAFAMMDSTTGRSMDRIKAKLEVVQVQIGQKLMPVVERLIGFIEDNWPKISAVMMPVIDAVSDGVRMFAEVLRGGESDDSFISKLAVYLRDELWPLVMDIKDWFVENWPKISEVISAVAGFIVDEVLPRVIKAIRFVAEVVGDVIGYIVDHWPQISEVVRQVIDFVVDEVLPRIVTAFDWIKERVQDFIEVFQRFWGAWGERITETVTNIFGEIQEFIAGTWETIVGVFNTFKGLFTGDWGLMWDGIVDVVSGIGRRLRATFMIAWEVFKFTFSALWEGLKTLVSRIFRDIVDYMKALPGDLKDAALSAVGAMTEAGTELAQALWDAIEEKVKGIPGMVGGFLKDVGGGVVDFFNPFSGGGGGGDGGGGGGGGSGPNGEFTMEDYGNPNSPAYTLMGGGGFDYTYGRGSSGGGTTNITVNTSTNADPGEITNSVVWGMQVAGVPS
jgi:TP901 family phage tail tape measure protein